MELVLNGEPVSIDDRTSLTIAELVERYPPNHAGYAVEVNKAVIARREHATHELRAGDIVEIVTLVGGG